MRSGERTASPKRAMRRALRVFTAGQWPTEDGLGTATLAYRERCCPARGWLRDDSGAAVRLDLPGPVVLADGDGLALEDGTFLAVRAAPEELAEVHSGDPGTLARLAWILGRHCAAMQVVGEALRFYRDPRLEAHAVGLGATVVVVLAPFTPDMGGASGEPGAGGAAS